MEDKIIKSDEIRKALSAFKERGNGILALESDDWEVGQDFSIPKARAELLPLSALVFGKSGAGDYLFLQQLKGTSDLYEARVFVFRHEEKSVQDAGLEFPSLLNSVQGEGSPSRPPIFYSDGKNKIELGDVVSVKGLFFRKPGKISYVPGVSKKNREFEHGGLVWIGVQFDDGTDTTIIVDGKKNLARNNLLFVERGKGL